MQARITPCRRQRAIVLLAGVIALGMLSIRLTYASLPAAQLLQRRTTVSWHGQRLGPALVRMREALDAPLWIDRRVDLSAVVDLEATDVSLAEMFESLRKSHGIDAAAVGPLLYVGPADDADALASLLQDARRQLQGGSAAVRRAWLAETKPRWRRLDEPRSALVELAREAGGALSNPEAVPHDLFDGAAYPPLARLDQATLLALGFDLTLQVVDRGRRIRLIPSPRVAKREQAKEARTGEPLEEPRQTVSPSSDLPRKPLSPSQRYTLRVVDQPLKNVLDQLSRQVGLEVHWDGGLSESSAEILRRTSCDATKATLDELLAALLEPVGLQSKRIGRRVHVSPAPADP